MVDDVSLATIDPDERDRVLAIECPNAYYAYPWITQIEPIPPTVLSNLDTLWNRSIHEGRTISFYRFANVVVAKEGLVFDSRGRLITCTRTYHSDEDVRDAYRTVGACLAGGSPKRVKNGILAKSSGAFNYGHFVVEMLPRAWLARHRLGLTDWPAVIYDRPQFVSDRSADALRVAGFGHDQVLVAGPEPVRFDELIVVDGLTSHSIYLSPFVMQCLDAVGAAIPAGSRKRLYVPRRPAVHRDFADEAGVARRLRRMGFQEIPTTTMPFAEQIAAFKGAEVVVGVMGAGLTNIAFCRPGTTVVSFTPASASEVFYWMLSQSRMLRYHEIRCPEIGPPMGQPWDRRIDVSPRRAERIVRASLPGDAPSWMQRIAAGCGWRRA